MSYPNLLSPIRMGPLTLPNRVAMAPMTRGRAGPALTANALIAEYYAQRAAAGLIITEGTHTSVLARGWFHAPDIFTPAHARAWRPATRRVHAAAGRIFCQLWHTGRASHSSFRDRLPGYEGRMKLPVAPSPVKRDSHSGLQAYTNRPGKVPIETPREMTLAEIDALPHEYRNAAQTAKDAGFDGVEIHCANGYLLDTFLQSVSNKRTDRYGGSLENRFRVVANILDAVLTVWHPAQVGIRLSPNGSFNGMGSHDFRESFLYYAQRIAQYNLAYLHLMIGLDFGFHEMGDPMTLAEFRNVYPGVIMGAVGFDADKADKEIAAGNCDMVSIGRPYISNPDYVERLAAGAQLNPPPSHETFYSSADKVFTTEGFTDYKTMAEQAALAN